MGEKSGQKEIKEGIRNICIYMIFKKKKKKD